MIVAIASEHELALLELHRAPELDPVLPAGANVEFVVRVSRWCATESGTSACVCSSAASVRPSAAVTGVAATALAVRYWAGENARTIGRSRCREETLGVRMFPAEDGEHVALSGPAQLVFSGEIELL